MFLGTVCSFLNACADLDRIDRFICVDDNSSAADRAEMERRFPFFEFIWKGPEDKGHVRPIAVERSQAGPLRDGNASVGPVRPVVRPAAG